VIVCTENFLVQFLKNFHEIFGLKRFLTKLPQQTETGQARPSAEMSEADRPEPRNICHQGTKTRRILFCYPFLVSWWLCGEKLKKGENGKTN